MWLKFLDAQMLSRILIFICQFGGWPFHRGLSWIRCLSDQLILITSVNLHVWMTLLFYFFHNSVLPSCSIFINLILIWRTMYLCVTFYSLHNSFLIVYSPHNTMLIYIALQFATFTIYLTSSSGWMSHGTYIYYM